MAVLFVISGGLRQFTGNRTDIPLAAAGALSEALAQLWVEAPAVRDRVLTERGEVRPHINIFVDGEDIRYRGGLDTPVRDGAEVFLVPALSGGSDSGRGRSGTRKPARLRASAATMPRVRALIVGLAALLAWSAAPAARESDGQAQKAEKKAGQTAAKKNPLLKLVEPWPSAEKLKARREAAEANPLFTATDVLPVTLLGDFKAINKDHDPNSRQRYPGMLRTADNVEVAVDFRARGHVRRMARTCDYVPLKLEFIEKKSGASTVFAKEDALKLVVQCAGGGDYEQYILREYLAYRIYNLLTQQSFRARLARVSYVDRATAKPLGTRLGMFLEDEADVARRLEGRVVALPRLRFDDLDPDALMPAMLFEYMIGNTDVSIYALHNVKVVQRQDKTLHVIPYDFDLSGLVHAPYAVPARGMMIKSVTDRVYRGPCRRQEQVDPYIANFVAKRDAIRALPETIPGIDRNTRDEVKSYIDTFYGSIRSTKDVRGLFVTCAAKPTM